MSTDIKDLSRKGAVSDVLTYEALNAGTLMRIADATELMAKNHDALLRAKKSAEESRDYWQAEHDRMQRRCRSLRGYITRLKHASRPSHGGNKP